MSLANSLAPASTAVRTFRCPKCGERLVAPASALRDQRDGGGLEAAQRRAKELEGQIRILTEKATTAADKLADYEDELRRLRSVQSSAPRIHTTTATSVVSAPAGAVAAGQSSPSSDKRPSSSSSSHQPQPQPQPQRRPQPGAGGGVQSRFSYFLGTRRSISNFNVPHGSGGSSTSVTTTTDLQAALSREQALRQEAEGRLTEASGELEELSAQLFQQANAMVATERKARAKLEERVAILERRDVEKRVRLERLEGAVQRIERVRRLLNRS